MFKRYVSINCKISYYFYLYLILYVCAIRFYMKKNFEKFLNSTGFLFSLSLVMECSER